MSYTSRYTELICGLPCEIWVGLSTAHKESTIHNIYCTITLAGTEVILSNDVKFDAMDIREEDMQQSIDRDIAFISAEHLVNLDSLRSTAYKKLRQLESIYADLFGVEYYVK